MEKNVQILKARGRQTMWKIFIEYDDKSKLTITGKHKDIPVELANKYYREYVKSSVCNATYQQYPKKDHKPMSLATKIMKLQRGGEQWKKSRCIGANIAETFLIQQN